MDDWGLLQEFLIFLTTRTSDGLSVEKNTRQQFVSRVNKKLIGNERFKPESSVTSVDGAGGLPLDVGYGLSGCRLSTTSTTTCETKYS